ncbi:phage tail tape measure protein [Arthrobacter sp. ISL-72]|uniref:phage tail tape measure protein n=1 Tax=Arthrobacter sp. ISL-72 TaxID=2819114 RepID=UPI001BE8BE1E|nr:phage tail tape measure protein [Arthrobacter sp. ISL-72]MBT2594730.1 phage tail tape measure protein [Arthrobacter sp. ISL-72]
MATQQLLFDILATSKGVDKTFQDVADSADSMAGKLGAAGAKATSKLFSPMTAAAAGGVAGAALMSGLHTAIDMDSITSTMTAGLNLAGPEAAKAGETAGKMYADGYGDSFEGVSAAVGATLSSIKGLSGQSAEDIQSVTSKVMDLSSAFELDVGRTAQIAGQMITTGLAKDGAGAADLLAATLSKVPVNVREDVLDAIDEYGPMFANLGMSGGEAMTMLADASAKGAFGIDKTGDALKEFTIRATDMSEATAGAYESLGMDQTDMTNKLLAGGDTARAAFDQIIMGLGDIKDPAQQSQAALALFGTPIEDLGTAEIPKFIDSLLNSQEALGTVEGSAGSLSDKLHSGPGEAFKDLQRTAETTLGQLGAQMLPILTPILEGLQQFAPIIGPGVLALGALAAVIAVVNFVMAMSPITWIIVGIVALIAAIVALVMNWDAVVAFLTEAWGGFMNWMMEVLGGFGNWWNEIWGGLGNWVTEVWNNIVGFLGGVWSVIAAVVMTGVHTVMDPIIAGFTAVWNFVSSVFTNIGNFIAGVWNWITSLVGNIIAAFVQTHGDQIAAIWNNIVAVFTAIGGFFVGIWNWYVGIITGALQAVWGVVSAVFTAVWGFISGVFTAIGGFVGAVWNTIVAVISGAVGAVWGAISSGFGAAWGFISGVFGQVAGFLGGVWGGIVSGVSGMVGNVLGVLGGLGSQIMGILSGAGNWLYGIGRNIVEGLISGVQSLAGTIGNAFLSMVPGWIVGPFKQALGIASPSKVFAGFGENIGEGVLVGVGRTQSRIDDRMASLVTVPEFATATGFGSTGTVGSSRSGASGGSTIDDLIQAIREQRPIKVETVPGSEETMARALAEQLAWKG